MIAVGSLVGFLLVFVAITWLSSVAMYGALAYFRSHLRRRGPRLERKAAAIAIVVPPLLGAAVMLSLAGYSLVSAGLGQDHCTLHDHHLHLCLLHGGPWLAKLWAVSLVSVISVIVAMRLAQRGHALWTTRTRLRLVAGVSRPVQQDTGDSVLLAPSHRLFCFVAGLWTPCIYASNTANERLDPDEWRGMIAHERAHIEQGDVWREAALSALAVTGAPIAAARALAIWKSATERLCDQVAARSIDNPSAVASALLTMSHGGPASVCSFAPSQEQLTDRITAVLAETADGAHAAKRLSIVVVAACVVVTITAAVLASPLHHALETLLGTA